MSSAFSDVLTGCGVDGRHAAEVVDLLGDRQRVLQLLAGVDLQLLGDGHVLGALEHLRVDDVGDDRLVLAGQVLVEQLDQLRARIRFGHGVSLQLFRDAAGGGATAAPPHS